MLILNHFDLLKISLNFDFLNSINFRGSKDLEIKFN